MEHSRSSALLAELAQFTGTQTYTRITRRHLLTDGARYLADQAECYWLMDAVASHLDEIGRKFRRELENTRPDGGHCHGLDACFLGNAKRLSDGKVKIPLGVIVIDVAGRPCMNDVWVRKIKCRGYYSITQSDGRISTAVLLQLGSCSRVDGTSDTRPEAQIRIC